MNRNSDIAALILAAGLSSRLGAWKPLQPIGQSTFMEESVQRFRAAGVEDIRVVTGHRAEELGPVLDQLGVKKVFNPDYHRGMFTSVWAGVCSLEPEISALFLLPVDIPLVKPNTINSLLESYSQGNARIIYPCFRGRRGHPPLISSTCLFGLPPACDDGLRAFLSRYNPEALDLEIMDEAILLDCDTPEDYHRLQAYASREEK